MNGSLEQGVERVFAAYRAANPFRFATCLETVEPLGKSVHNAEGLLEIIETAPPSCIVCHTQTCLLRSPHCTEFTNDFADWIAHQIGDTVLASRLSDLDSFAYTDTERLRIALLSVMADHLSRHAEVRRRPSRKPFEAYSSRMTVHDLRREAWTLDEFQDALSVVDSGSIYLHTCRARVLNDDRNDDFVRWLGDEAGLNLPTLADQLTWESRLALNLEQRRQRILYLCNQAKE